MNITSTVSFREKDDEELLAWLKAREGNPIEFGGVNIRNQLHELMAIAQEAGQ
jgi:hypothetical protein